MVAYRHRSRSTRVRSFLKSIRIYAIEEVSCRQDLRFGSITSVECGDQRRASIRMKGLLAQRAIEQV